MSDEAFVEVRNIQVNSGDILEVQMTQMFIDRIRQHFGLLNNQVLEDDHVKMYLWGAVNTAVDKAERKISEDATKQQLTESPKRVRRTRSRAKNT